MFQRLADRPAHDPASDADQQQLREIAASMRELDASGEDNPRLPAGYVYLGQFVDHDVSFDPRASFSAETTLMVF
jgi:hypothetical protein